MKYKKVFFVGINGVSMSALALLTLKMGVQVAGSDRTFGELARKLKKKGVKIFKTHKASNIKGCDLVVFSGAVASDNKELVQARKLNIKTMERSEYLGLISKNYKNVIAISGTHGKTTTSAMIGYIFLLAGKNPTVHIGGEFKYFNGNLFVGGKEFFITEACEFRDSFLKLKPNVSVITNIEKEHLDYFKNFERETMSFNKFAKKTKDSCYALLVTKNLLRDDLNVTFCSLSKTMQKSNSCPFEARNIKILSDGKYSFDVYYGGKFLDEISLGVPGEFNVKNALLAIAVARHYGIEMDVIKLALKTFCNVDRRFELIGEKDGNIVLQDYAHHPTEIGVTIKMCREVYEKPIVCIFQPHTFSRTRTLINEFLSCFDGVSELVLLSTYSAREKYVYLGSVDYLKDKLLAGSPKYKIAGVFDKKGLAEQLKKYKNCVLLFLGAGDINICAKDYAGKKGGREKAL